MSSLYFVGIQFDVGESNTSYQQFTDDSVQNDLFRNRTTNFKEISDTPPNSQENLNVNGSQIRMDDTEKWNQIDISDKDHPQLNKLIDLNRTILDDLYTVDNQDSGHQRIIAQYNNGIKIIDGISGNILFNITNLFIDGNIFGKTIVDADQDGNEDILFLSTDSRLKMVNANNGSLIWNSQLSQYAGSVSALDIKASNSGSEILLGGYQSVLILDAKSGSLLHNITNLLNMVLDFHLIELSGDGINELILLQRYSIVALNGTFFETSTIDLPVSSTDKITETILSVGFQRDLQVFNLNDPIAVASIDDEPNYSTLEFINLSTGVMYQEFNVSYNYLIHDFYSNNELQVINITDYNLFKVVNTTDRSIISQKTLGQTINYITKYDINNDNIPELLISSYGGNILINMSTMGIIPLESEISTSGLHSYVSDINKDGYLDLIQYDIFVGVRINYRDNTAPIFNYIIEPEIRDSSQQSVFQVKLQEPNLYDINFYFQADYPDNQFYLADNIGTPDDLFIFEVPSTLSNNIAYFVNATDYYGEVSTYGTEQSPNILKMASPISLISDLPEAIQSVEPYHSAGSLNYAITIQGGNEYSSDQFQLINGITGNIDLSISIQDFNSKIISENFDSDENPEFLLYNELGSYLKLLDSDGTEIYTHNITNKEISAVRTGLINQDTIPDVIYIAENEIIVMDGIDGSKISSLSSEQIIYDYEIIDKENNSYPNILYWTSTDIFNFNPLSINTNNYLSKNVSSMIGKVIDVVSYIGPNLNYKTAVYGQGGEGSKILILSSDGNLDQEITELPNGYDWIEPANLDPTYESEDFVLVNSNRSLVLVTPQIQSQKIYSISPEIDTDNRFQYHISDVTGDDIDDIILTSPNEILFINGFNSETILKLNITDWVNGEFIFEDTDSNLIDEVIYGRISGGIVRYEPPEPLYHINYNIGGNYPLDQKQEQGEDFEIKLNLRDFYGNSIDSASASIIAINEFTDETKTIAVNEKDTFGDYSAIVNTKDWEVGKWYFYPNVFRAPYDNLELENFRSTTGDLRTIDSIQIVGNPVPIIDLSKFHESTTRSTEGLDQVRIGESMRLSFQFRDEYDSILDTEIIETVRINFGDHNYSRSDALIADNQIVFNISSEGLSHGMENISIFIDGTYINGHSLKIPINLVPQFPETSLLETNFIKIILAAFISFTAIMVVLRHFYNNLDRESDYVRRYIAVLTSLILFVLVAQIVLLYNFIFREFLLFLSLFIVLGTVIVLAFMIHFQIKINQYYNLKFRWFSWVKSLIVSIGVGGLIGFLLYLGQNVPWVDYYMGLSSTDLYIIEIPTLIWEVGIAGFVSGFLYLLILDLYDGYTDIQHLKDIKRKVKEGYYPKEPNKLHDVTVEEIRTTFTELSKGFIVWYLVIMVTMFNSLELFPLLEIFLGIGGSLVLSSFLVFRTNFSGVLGVFGFINREQD